MTWLKRIFLVIIILIVFGTGFWLGREAKICPFCAPKEVDFSIMWEAWHKLKESYVNSDELDEQEMVWGATEGMIKSVGDPYTVFFNPEETKKFLEDVSGKFEGVGMEIGIKNGQLQVITPLEGTPAEKAGLRPGDKIIKIDDVLTLNITIEEAVSLIRGAKGSEVVLIIMRDGWKNSEEFKIKRDVIKVPSLKWEIKENNTAYIKIYHFSENLDRDFRTAAVEILKTSADRIVLDLRSNPGGYLERAQDVAGWFLEKSQVVVIEDFSEKEEQIVYKAKGGSEFLNYPIVILINEGTASASEILASALRDNRGIKLIGKTSYGKGSVQKLEHLQDGSSLKVTIAKWLTPAGEHITDKGLIPDIEVDFTEEDYLQDKDPQLNKALEIIKKIN